jgi:hypothetical protein
MGERKRGKMKKKTGEGERNWNKTRRRKGIKKGNKNNEEDGREK